MTSPAAVAVTLTTKFISSPLLVTDVHVTVAVELERSTSAHVKVVSSITSSNTTSKSIEPSVSGSDCPDAWSIVTDGEVVSELQSKNGLTHVAGDGSYPN